MSNLDELKKEAKNYAKRLFDEEEQAYLHDMVVRVYVESAEPREKRIAELEAQIEQLVYFHNEDLETIRILNKLIEKMKCCTNCKHSRTVYEHCKTDKLENWEIKEK